MVAKPKEGHPLKAANTLKNLAKVHIKSKQPRAKKQKSTPQ